MKFSNYLAFDNAIEAVKYYEDTYAATSHGHMTLPAEHLEHFKMPADTDLTKTTFSVVLNVFEAEFALSDRFDCTGDFSDSVNMMINMSEEEKDKFAVIRKQVENDKEGSIIYDGKTDTYEMLRLKDKYGIIWSFMMMYNN